MTSLNTAWEYGVTKIIKNYIIHTVIPILLIITGFVFELKDLYPILLLLGFGYIFYMIVKWVNFYSGKKEYFKRCLDNANKHQPGEKYCSYTFNDKDFEYNDNKRVYKLNWELFEPYVIYKDTIMLIYKDNSTFFGAISKQEVSKEDFAEIREILNEKIGFKEI
jgi:hypothetical protein